MCYKNVYVAQVSMANMNSVIKAFNEAKINIPFNRMDVTLLTEETNPPVSKKA